MWAVNLLCLHDKLPTPREPPRKLSGRDSEERMFLRPVAENKKKAKRMNFSHLPPSFPPSSIPQELAHGPRMISPTNFAQRAPLATLSHRLSLGGYISVIPGGVPLPPYEYKHIDAGANGLVPRIGWKRAKRLEREEWSNFPRLQLAALQGGSGRTKTFFRFHSQSQAKS